MSGLQALLASREEAARLLVREDGVAIGSRLWPGIEAVIAGESGRERSRAGIREMRTVSRWGWAAAAALLGVLVIGFLLLRDFRPEWASTDVVQARFELDYVRIGGQPANAVIYQPQGSDMIVIWVEKSL